MSATVYFLPGALEARTKAREGGKATPGFAEPAAAPQPVDDEFVCLRLLRDIAQLLGLPPLQSDEDGDAH